MVGHCRVEALLGLLLSLESRNLLVHARIKVNRSGHVRTWPLSNQAAALLVVIPHLLATQVLDHGPEFDVFQVRINDLAFFTSLIMIVKGSLSLLGLE